MSRAIDELIHESMQSELTYDTVLDTYEDFIYESMFSSIDEIGENDLRTTLFEEEF